MRHGWKKTTTENGLMGAKLDFYKTALRNRAKKGFLGYPVATIAFYGPDDRRATKVALGIIFDEDDDTRREMNRWISAKGDIRRDATVFEAMFRLTQSRGVRWKMPDALQAAVAKHHKLKFATRDTDDFPPKLHRFVIVPYTL
jgi:hypothetical protein